MSSYGRIYSDARRRKSHRGIKIFLGILIALLVAGSIAFALNYNTVMLFMGKGKVSMQSTPSIEKSLKASGAYENVQADSDGSGSTTVTAQSKDGAVDITSTTDSSGRQSVGVQMDIKKMDGVGSSKSLANLQAMTQKINEYLAPVVDPSQLTGVESYITREAIAQYKSGKSSFSISNNFNGTQLDVSGNFETKTVKINAETT